MKRRALMEVGAGLSALVLMGCQRRTIEPLEETSFWDRQPEKKDPTKESSHRDRHPERKEPTGLSSWDPQPEKREPVKESSPREGLPENVDWRQVNSEFWLTGHPRITQWRREYSNNKTPWKLWKRAEPYLPVIRAKLSKSRLPLEFCLLPMVESSFNPLARSERAAGMWQFVVPTALEMGLVVNSRLDERLDWSKSTVAASRYLTQLARKFNGNWGLVLAAYNMGPGAILQAVKAQGSEDFWSLRLRQETADYVPKFLAMVQLLRESFPEV